MILNPFQICQHFADYDTEGTVNLMIFQTADLILAALFALFIHFFFQLIDLLKHIAIGIFFNVRQQFTGTGQNFLQFR